jgi:ABC-type nickel/cobalt efflux system permease component RcnA
MLNRADILGRLAICLAITILFGALLFGASAAAQVQSAHPFAVPQQTLNTPSLGWFDQWTGQIAIWQSQFYKQLTTAVRAWKADGFQAWWLLALSFAYGVFHALGPGHGKAILSAYVVANRETLRNGAILAFVSSLVQALVAIVLVAVAAGLMNVTGAVLNEMTAWLELSAYGLLVMLGVWLVYKHLLKPIANRFMSSLVSAPSHHHHDHHGHDSHCGHTHFPAPEQVAGQLSLRKAWGAILAIGLRPCSGAILVLVFALSQQFFWAGAAAALAMGFGTGLTVAALALTSLTVSRAMESAGGGRQRPWGRWIGGTLQASAALLVLLFGLLLFSAAWQYSVSLA